MKKQKFISVKLGHENNYRNHDVFHAELNKHLNSGWRVIPDTLKILPVDTGVYSYYVLIEEGENN